MLCQVQQYYILCQVQQYYILCQVQQYYILCQVQQYYILLYLSGTQDARYKYCSGTTVHCGTQDVQQYCQVQQYLPGTQYYILCQVQQYYTVPGTTVLHPVPGTQYYILCQVQQCTSCARYSITYCCTYTVLHPVRYNSINTVVPVHRYYILCQVQQYYILLYLYNTGCNTVVPGTQMYNNTVVPDTVRCNTVVQQYYTGCNPVPGTRVLHPVSGTTVLHPVPRVMYVAQDVHCVHTVVQQYYILCQVQQYVHPVTTVHLYTSCDTTVSCARYSITSCVVPVPQDVQQYCCTCTQYYILM